MPRKRRRNKSKHKSVPKRHPDPKHVTVAKFRLAGSKQKLKQLEKEREAHLQSPKHHRKRERQRQSNEAIFRFLYHKLRETYLKGEQQL